MSINLLIDLISDCFSELFTNLSMGIKTVSLELPRSARIPVLTAIWNKTKLPIVYLTDRSDHALAIYEELDLWQPQIHRLFFPEPNPLFYEKSPWGENTRRERLASLTALASYYIPGMKQLEYPPLIIVPARAAMSRTIPRRDFLKATRFLHVGQKFNPDQSLNTWILLGYEIVNTVIIPGQSARRGGILDIWPISSSYPIRIELFGDVIETLRFFDPTTQRTIKSNTLEPLQKFLITPAKEYITTAGIESQLQVDLSELHEFYLPLIHPTPASILDYLPQKSLLIIDDEISLRESIVEIEEQSIKLRADAIKNGNISEDFPPPYLSWSEIVDTILSYKPIKLGSEIPHNELETEIRYSKYFSPGLRFAGRLKIFMEHLIELYQAGNPILIVSRQRSRLEELWNENYQIHKHVLKEIETTPLVDYQNIPRITFVQGSLSEGWIFQSKSNSRIYLFSDGEIFGIRPAEPRKRQHFTYLDPEAEYTDLQPGDYVVHIDHGIGIFIGLVTRTIDGMLREYFCVEYADAAQLYIPVYQADRLTRYVGPDRRKPTLSRLGSSEWHSVKNHVKEAVQEVAQDLLELYARRSIIQGYSFAKDSTWQQELELSFPYIETEDQIRVLNEVKNDMEATKPMDRLICGDVGYGKTEVALRAAFKCVMDGKQVAMLVPTTILAQQHYTTFSQRLSAFPVTVEMLSRFRSNNEQRIIIDKLQSGVIDIIIGTHRMLSSDVKIKDLGLLIIDEEQRFGVTHKEKLKKLRTEVDVLTLTATPIPRTLYMALTGVRDISTINTPPEERLPIITHVGPYAPDLVRKAILRELERGGQVFFVHNRVQTIRGMANHLEKLIPEAKLAIAHGQMLETELSERMRQFNAGEIDILLSTSIIESGLDIPNANTLIVDRADSFGLAQLYQLRGRVGRGAQRAYAYFFRHPRKSPSIEGRQRLETIAENTQLGAGFSIAMRDLEIRGTGDILGTRQSGNVAAVGYHLYTHLLSQAVNQLRSSSNIAFRSAPKDDFNGMGIIATVDLPLDINIPIEYVSEKSLRLKLYRRLAQLHSNAELETIAEEFSDRFGPPPQPVLNMLFQLKIKLLTEKAGISSISVENGQLVLRFPDGNLPHIIPGFDSSVRIGKTAIWIPCISQEDWQGILENTLLRLQSNISDNLPI